MVDFAEAASRGPSALADILVNLGAIHISGMAKATAVKFCAQVGYIKSVIPKD